MLPLALILGFQAWLGLAIIILLPGFFIRLLAGAPAAATTISDKAFVPPGSVVFVPIASSLGLGTGLVVGFLSDTYVSWVVAVTYWLVGTAYDFVAGCLPVAAIFPFPIRVEEILGGRNGRREV